jgi:hypothetical protein
MLEERARVMLNFAHPDDLVIFLNRQPAAPAPAAAAPAKTILN